MTEDTSQEIWRISSRKAVVLDSSVTTYSRDGDAEGEE